MVGSCSARKHLCVRSVDVGNAATKVANFACAAVHGWQYCAVVESCVGHENYDL